MKKGQKLGQWRLHNNEQLKEAFQFLLDDFDVIYEIISKAPLKSHFKDLGTAISMRIRILREHHPHEAGIFIPLFQDLYERWRIKTQIFEAL